MQALSIQSAHNGAAKERPSSVANAQLESNIAYARRLCKERSTTVTHDALQRLAELIELYDHANLTAKDAIALTTIVQQAMQTQQ